MEFIYNSILSNANRGIVPLIVHPVGLFLFHHALLSEYKEVETSFLILNFEQKSLSEFVLNIEYKAIQCYN